MDSTVSFHYGNWRAKAHVMWILTNQQEYGDVMPSSSHGKMRHEIHLLHFARGGRYQVIRYDTEY